MKGHFISELMWLKIVTSNKESLKFYSDFVEKAIFSNAYANPLIISSFLSMIFIQSFNLLRFHVLQ